MPKRPGESLESERYKARIKGATEEERQERAEEIRLGEITKEINQLKKKRTRRPGPPTAAQELRTEKRNRLRLLRNRRSSLKKELKSVERNLRSLGALKRRKKKDG